MSPVGARRFASPCDRRRPARDLQVDPAPCVAAAASHDDDKSIEVCGALIDNEKTAKADRVKALIARGEAFARKDMIDRAIADYDACCSSIPRWPMSSTPAASSGARRATGAKALADFGAAIKLNPDHAAAKANYKSLAQELERLGALMAVAGKPSFNCATARRAVEKAICANPELADLDREINAMTYPGYRRSAESARRSPHAAARAGCVYRPPQCRVRPAGLRFAQGHERAAAAARGRRRLLAAPPFPAAFSA